MGEDLARSVLEKLYSELGLNYIKQNTMLSLLKRHYPAVAPALEGLDNAFHPWKDITTPRTP